MVLVQRDLDRRAQAVLVEWLDDVAQRLRVLRALHHVVVGVRGQEDARNRQRLAKLDRRFDAVKGAGEVDVHQGQLRAKGRGQLEGFFAAVGYCDDLVPELRELTLDVERDDAFIFDDENAGFAFHDEASSDSCALGANAMLNVVPG